MSLWPFSFPLRRGNEPVRIEDEAAARSQGPRKCTEGALSIFFPRHVHERVICCDHEIEGALNGDYPHVAQNEEDVLESPEPLSGLGERVCHNIQGDHRSGAWGQEPVTRPLPAPSSSTFGSSDSRTRDCQNSLSFRFVCSRSRNRPTVP